MTTATTEGERKTPLEIEITRKIQRWLNSLPHSFQRKIKGEGYIEGRGGAQKPGLPDLFCCVGGYSFWVEVKSATGRLSPLQERTIKDMEWAGVKVFVVRSVDELKAQLIPLLPKQDLFSEDME